MMTVPAIMRVNEGSDLSNSDGLNLRKRAATEARDVEVNTNHPYVAICLRFQGFFAELIIFLMIK